MCSFVVVIGWGCFNGFGFVLIVVLIVDVWVCVGCVEVGWGEGLGGEDVEGWLIVFWLDGRMLSVEFGFGIEEGGGICCEDWWCEWVRVWGEVGIELRFGMMFSKVCFKGLFVMLVLRRVGGNC